MMYPLKWQELDMMYNSRQKDNVINKKSYIIPFSSKKWGYYNGNYNIWIRQKM